VVSCLGLIYVGRLDGPFVFDDLDGIEHNESLESLATALTAPPNTPPAGRPISNLSLAMTRLVAGPTPGAQHRVNLLLHGLVSLFALAALRRMLRLDRMPDWIRERADGVAFAAALLFAVHPIAVDIVLYAVQRTALCLALFYVVMFYAGLRAAEADASRDSGAGAWYGAAWLACLLGMGSKEVMVTAPVLFLFLDRAFLSGSFREALRRRRRLYLGLAACYLPLLALQLTSPRPESTSGFDPLYFALQGDFLAEYLGRAIWPASNVLDYGRLFPGRPAPMLLPGLATLALVLGCLVLTFTHPRAGFAGAWLFGILAPSSSFITISTEVGADRRMYLPLLAVITVGVLSCVAMARRLTGGWSPERRRVLLATLLAMAVLGLGLRSRHQTLQFASTLAFWQHAAEQTPENPRAHYNLGETYRHVGRLEPAITHYRRAIELHPLHIGALSNLGVVLSLIGRPGEAIAILKRAVATEPDSAWLHYNLALVAQRAGRYGEALTELETVFELDPDPALPTLHSAARTLRAQIEASGAAP
jgi:tetratricopeptide (TPR) repeat protein